MSISSSKDLYLKKKKHPPGCGGVAAAVFRFIHKMALQHGEAWIQTARLIQEKKTLTSSALTVRHAHPAAPLWS